MANFPPNWRPRRSQGRPDRLPQCPVIAIRSPTSARRPSGYPRGHPRYQNALKTSPIDKLALCKLHLEILRAISHRNSRAAFNPIDGQHPSHPRSQFNFAKTTPELHGRLDRGPRVYTFDHFGRNTVEVSGADVIRGASTSFAWRLTPLSMTGFDGNRTRGSAIAAALDWQSPQRRFRSRVVSGT